MVFRHYARTESRAIVQLSESVFTDSEGEAAGLLIGKLVENLFEQTDEPDLLNFVAEVNGQLVASIFFTRLSVDSEDVAFILSPVAVHTEHQHKGIGQALIGYGLNELEERRVRFVLTYGDPLFYGKVGFRQISAEVVKPPFALSQPEGWLGHSLLGDPIDSLAGSVQCVKALSDPVYW